MKVSRWIGLFGLGTIQSGNGKAHSTSSKSLVSASAAPSPLNIASQTIPGAKMTLKLRLVKQAG